MTKISPTDQGSDGSLWTASSAKAHFGELLKRARQGLPQTITRNGRPAAVLVAVVDWERKTRRTGTLVDFFKASPLRGAEDLVLNRSRDVPSEMTL
jgi:prevent-host-death family protein